jgi:hypothetical protein
MIEIISDVLAIGGRKLFRSGVDELITTVLREMIEGGWISGRIGAQPCGIALDMTAQGLDA